MASPLDIFKASMDGAERGRERGLAQLMGKAYGAPREQRSSILGQVAQLGAPQAAFQAESHFQSMDDNARKRFADYALAFQALPDEQKPMAYPQFAQQAQTLGIPAPTEWRPEFAPNIAKLAQALGGLSNGMPAGVQEFQFMSQGLSADEAAKARRIQLGLDPRALSSTMQTITVEGENGQPEQWTFNKATGRYERMSASVGRGFGQPPSQPGVQLESMPFVFDDQNMPPQVISAIQQQEAAAGNAPMMGQASMQAASLPPPLDYQGGGQVGVGMTAAAKAAAQEAAKQGVQTQFLPEQERIKMEAAIERARGEAQAKSEVEVGAAAAKKSREAGQTLNLLKEAKTLLGKASGGAMEAGRDRALGVFNVSTEGARATASLKLLSAKLIANVPRFEGPQSNIDVQFYREAAGDLANDNLPVATRLAAADTMIRLAEQYAGGNESGGLTPEEQAELEQLRTQFGKGR